MLPYVIEAAILEELRDMPLEQQEVWGKTIQATPIRSLVRLVPHCHRLYFYGASKGFDMTSLFRCNACQLAQYLQLRVARQERDTEFLNRKTPDNVVQMMVLSLDHPAEALLFVPTPLRLQMLRDPDMPFPATATAARQRYANIRASPYFHEIERLLDIQSDHGLRRYAKGKIPTNSFVEALITLDALGAQRFCEEYDVVLPAHADPEVYVASNIYSYRFVDKTRVVADPERLSLSDMRLYSDLALIEGFGSMPGYSSRDELEARLCQLASIPSFFFPLVLSPAVSNPETTYLTPTADPSLYLLAAIEQGHDPAVAYGTLEDFRVYDLDELEGAFVGAFRVPEAPHTVFSPGKVDELASALWTAGMGQTLLEQVRTAIRDMRSKEATTGHAAVVARLRGIRPKRKEDILSMLDLVFSAAMYMRRWRGPGTPYPIQAKDTLISLDPMQNVSEALSLAMPAFYALSEKSSVARELQVYSRVGPTFVCQSSLLSTLLERIANNDMCIRIASALLLCTVFFYSAALGSPRLDFDIASLDVIG